jgi:hypothetical protein
MIIGTRGLEVDPGKWLEPLLLRANEWLPSPRITYYDALLRDYEEADDDYRSEVHQGLRKVLEEALDRGDARLLRPAIDFIRDAGVAALAQVLKDLVRKRTLDQGLWARTDLHGRALEALNAFEDLHVLETWEEEVKYRRFAPLAFSFVRDSAPDAPDELPSLFPDAARLGFLRQALESTVSKLLASRPGDRGFELLLEGAKWVRASKIKRMRSRYRKAVIELHLAPVLQYRILRELEPERYKHLAVLSRLSDPLHSAVSDLLKGEGVRVTTDRGWDEDIEGRTFLLLTRNSRSMSLDESEVDSPLAVNVCVGGEKSYDKTREMELCSVADESHHAAGQVVDAVLSLLPELASIRRLKAGTFASSGRGGKYARGDMVRVIDGDDD